MRGSMAVWLAVVAGCSEYDLIGDPPGSGLTETDVDPDQDPFDSADDDCADQTIPAYSTSMDADCQNEVATGTFTPVVEWKMATFPGPAGSQVMSQPIVSTVNDDNEDGVVDENDIPDILVVSYDSNWTNGGILRAVSGDGSRVHYSIAGSGIQGMSGLAAGDIDNDGLVEIVALTPDGAAVFENDGVLKWKISGLTGHIDGTADTPAISDMDGDGSPEIIAGRAILNADGTVRGKGTHGKGGVDDNNVGTCAFAVDLDGDGVQEVITGNAAYRPDGSTIWYNNLSDGYPAVADFDGDGEGEIAVVGQGQVRLLDTDGTKLWGVAVPGASGFYYGGPPTIADFDGDGDPDIGVAAGSRYSVFTKEGTVLWQAVTDDSSSGNTGSAVFDFEGDGVAEVVYADETRLWVYSGIDGSVKMASTEHSNGTWLEYPSIADVDGDGHAEIVVPNEYQNGNLTGIYVFGDANDSWRPARKTWNQFAYHITNIGDDGSVAAVAEQNWLSYNNFRSGDMGAGDGLAAPDLTVAQADLCNIDCDEDRLVLWAQLGNEGAVDLLAGSNPRLEVYVTIDGADQLVQTIELGSDVRAGYYEDSVQIEIEGLDPTTFDRVVLKAVTDELECDELNNELEWDGPFCD